MRIFSKRKTKCHAWLKRHWSAQCLRLTSAESTRRRRRPQRILRSHRWGKSEGTSNGRNSETPFRENRNWDPTDPSPKWCQQKLEHDQNHHQQIHRRGAPTHLSQRSSVSEIRSSVWTRSGRFRVQVAVLILFWGGRTWWTALKEIDMYIKQRKR